MEGEIGVESVPGKGACFWFELPYRVADKVPTEKAESTPSVKALLSHAKCRILLAEDNKINQKIAVAMLKKMGLNQVDVVDNGHKAVQQLVKQDYDLVLMDLQMSECGGLEACRQIRGKAERAELNVAVRNSQVPVIALTANAMASDIEECRETGMNSHVGKPIKIGLLEAELKKWLPADGCQGD
jgi:CheY-like chemotaxis protein